MKKITVFFLLVQICLGSVYGQSLFRAKNAQVNFVSEAPLELIQASTTTVAAILDTSKMEFAVSIPIVGFVGFNSPLQQEHFYENYMETDEFPKATFSGKILDSMHYRLQPFTALAKGKLVIHGEAKDRIIELSCVWIDRDTLRVNAAFEVPLADHNIEIPRVVFQKIAEVIRVSVQLSMQASP